LARAYSRPAHRGCAVRGWVANVEQSEAFANQWQLTVMEVDVNGKALFFKTIAMQEEEYRCDFRRVWDDLTLAEAADLLIKRVIVAANRKQDERPQPPQGGHR
jgi:hypothetical protein